MIKIVSPRWVLPLVDFTSNTLLQVQEWRCRMYLLQIINATWCLMFLLQSVCQSSSSRFVDDPFYNQSGDLTSFFGRWRWESLNRQVLWSLPLWFPYQGNPRCFFHLLKDHCRDLLWWIFLIHDLDTRVLFSPRTTWYGTRLISFVTWSNDSPINRLIEKIVFLICIADAWQDLHLRRRYR